MNFETSFIKLLHRKDLTLHEAYTLFLSFFRRQLPAAIEKAVLLLLSRKGEAAAEVLGCLKAVQAIEKPYAHSFKNLIDTCGTGGDRSHSTNVSTLAALVIAAAGGNVAKHGNRSISSKCGSTDLIEALGIPIPKKSSEISKSIQKNGFAYIHAPYHHPVFAAFQPLRRSLKTRTIFNLLGPLLNPLRPSRQIIGVSSIAIFDLYVKVLSALKATALVCHSEDGMDEISISARTRIAIIKKGRVRLQWINPRQLGFPKYSPGAVRGGHSKQNAKLARRLLSGKLRGPARDIVILNAGAGLYIGGLASNIPAGVQRAAHAIDNGKTERLLHQLRE